LIGNMIGHRLGLTNVDCQKFGVAGARRRSKKLANHVQVIYGDVTGSRLKKHPFQPNTHHKVWDIFRN
jgi:hypothetical protein